MSTIGVLMSTKAPTDDNNSLTHVNNQATLDNTKPQASSLSEPQPEVIFYIKSGISPETHCLSQKKNANGTLPLAF